MDEVRALLLHSVSHQLFLGALGADNVLTVRDEALPHLRRVRADVQTFSHQERLKHNIMRWIYPDHAGLAGRADEAVVVPVAALERDEPRASDS